MGFGTHFGSAAVPGAFARTRLDRGVCFRSDERAKGPKLALEVDHSGPILLGEIDQLPVRQLSDIHSGECSKGAGL